MLHQLADWEVRHFDVLQKQHLRVFFPRLKQTREYGFVLEPDGTLRAVYNRSQQGQYTIRNGKFTANGNPTMALHKCM